jgi:hypothetical protein
MCLAHYQHLSKDLFALWHVCMRKKKFAVGVDAHSRDETWLGFKK